MLKLRFLHHSYQLPQGLASKRGGVPVVDRFAGNSC